MTPHGNGTVVCDDIKYEVDGDRSTLCAIVSRKELQWYLEINTHENTDLSEEDRLISNPSMYVTFPVPNVKDWRELPGNRVQFQVNPTGPYLLLPDNPTSVYIGYHLFPYEHDIEFTQREENRLFVKWHCLAGDELELPPTQLFAIGKITFTGVVVSFHEDFEELKRSRGGSLTLEEFQAVETLWQPDYKLADELLSIYFDRRDFGAPEKRMWDLTYPLVATV